MNEKRRKIQKEDFLYAGVSSPSHCNLVSWLQHLGPVSRSIGRHMTHRYYASSSKPLFKIFSVERMAFDLFPTCFCRVVAAFALLCFRFVYLVARQVAIAAFQVTASRDPIDRESHSPLSACWLCPTLSWKMGPLFKLEDFNMIPVPIASLWSGSG